MSFLDSIFLGLVQGITEFLPISSSGHLILAQRYLGIPIDGASLSFAIFVNCATLLAVIIALWGDIRRIVVDIFTEGPSMRSKKVLSAIFWGTIPAATMGFFFQSQISELFYNPRFVAYALIAGSVLFFIADRIPKEHNEPHGVTALKGLFIGIFQTFALIPGISRSGITTSGGLFFGLSREEAIKFAFLLYIPISVGAGLKIIFDSVSPSFSYSDPTVWVGFFVAFLSGLISVKFLIKFLSRNSFNVFIVYRLLLAGVILYFF